VGQGLSSKPRRENQDLADDATEGLYKSNRSVDPLRGPSALPPQPFRHAHCPHGHGIGPGGPPIKYEMSESPTSPQSGLGKALRSRGGVP
jgi:hypothetical protein